MNPKAENIVNNLRGCVFDIGQACDKCAATGEMTCSCSAELMLIAADLIEQLQQEFADEHYRHDRLQDLCVAQGEELSRLKVQQRWIPATERLPEHREAVLTICVARREGSKKFHRINCYDAIMDEWVLTAPLHKVTHWMPLPEPPTEV